MKSEIVREDFKKLVEAGKSKSEILELLPISKSTYYYWKKELKYTVEPAPKSNNAIKDIVELKKKVFNYEERKEAYYSEIPVKFKSKEPIALMFLGDPHLDNPATDLELFETHLNLAKSNENVHIIGMGDYLDNWIGYLTKLYAKHSITQEEAFELINHYFKDVPFLAMVIGNHDYWNNFDLYFKEVLNKNVVVSDDIRLSLRWEDQDDVKIHVRHSFRGKSQYNPAFPLVKQAIFNKPDDIIAMGHMHQLGYQVYPQPYGHLSHCFVVGSYKRFDDYGKSIMTHETNLSPCVVTVIDPTLNRNDLDRIKLFYDPFKAIDYLNSLKSSAK